MISSNWLLKAATIFIAILLISSVPGVFASWNYAQAPVVASEDQLHIGYFEWIGSEVLPEDGEVGEDHRWLIENILNGDGVGVNDPDSMLLSELDYREESYGRDHFGSVAVRNADTINSLLGNAAEELTFIIQKAKDPVSGEDIFYVYTTSVKLGERGESMWLFGAQINTKKGSPTVPIGDVVAPVYRTTLRSLYGTWTAAVTEEGSATSAWYDENQKDKYKNATQIPSFNPNSWVAKASE